MKKTIISLIIIVFVTSHAIQAQASDTESESPQIYGQLRLSVDDNSSDFGDGKAGTSVQSNSSRLGFQGIMKSVFDGTEVFYRAEIQYGAADEVDAEIKWREGYAGLMGKWGKFRLGRLSVQYKNTLTKIDPWNDNVSQSRGSGGRQGSSAFHSSYFNNAVDYVSPKYHGVSASVWFSSQFDGEDNEIHNAGPINNYLGGTAAGLGAQYEEGPLFLAVDYIDVNADSIASTNMTNGSGWKVAGRYKLQNFSVSALYEDVQDLGLGNNIYVNGIYKIDKLRLIATYGQNRDATQYGNREIDAMSAGVKYALSKTTELFGVYNIRDEGTLKYNTISSGLNIKFGY